MEHGEKGDSGKFYTDWFYTDLYLYKYIWFFVFIYVQRWFIKKGIFLQSIYFSSSKQIIFARWNTILQTANSKPIPPPQGNQYCKPEGKKRLLLKWRMLLLLFFIMIMYCYNRQSGAEWTKERESYNGGTGRKRR